MKTIIICSSSAPFCMSGVSVQEVTGEAMTTSLQKLSAIALRITVCVIQASLIQSALLLLVRTQWETQRAV